MNESILLGLNKHECRLIMMAMKSINEPMGHLAMDWFGGEYPLDKEWIDSLIDKRLLGYKNSQQVVHEGSNGVTSMRFFYTLTEEGKKVGEEIRRRLVLCSPQNLNDYKRWVYKLAGEVLDQIPQGEVAIKELEQLKEQLNSIPTDFEIITKIDTNNETWDFDVIRRIGKRRNSLNRKRKH